MLFIDKNKGIIPAAILSLGVAFSVPAQQVRVNEAKLAENLLRHVVVLAADSMEGRETGTKGEKMAADYIAEQFRKAGLKSKSGNSTYFQPFKFTKGIHAGPGNRLEINARKFVIGQDYYPLAYSSSTHAEGDIFNAGFGIKAPDLDYNDYADKGSQKGKIFVMELSSPDGIHPHSKYNDHSDIRKKLNVAIEEGATAVIFINSDPNLPNPEQTYTKRITPVTIPVMFATGMAFKLLTDGIGTKASLTADLVKEEGTGYNVVGYINRRAKNTMVLGAHYDHLGYGDEGSLHRGEAAIHNGADDNASGVAVIIETARYLKKIKPRNNNYLIIAFSGEEKGLLGSASYVRNPTLKLESMNCMLNYDMVGRLDPESKTLVVNGAGTSTDWSSIFEKSAGELKFKTTESGIGPSDHTSFYLRDIPALHFFTGSHSDYHKPGDDADKVNYAGMESIVKMNLRLIEEINKKDRLNFTKTKDAEQQPAPRMKVTLGVVPDYIYEGKGMRIDGVTDGKPAQEAGIIAGDIILQIGEHEVAEMFSYMKALGKFNKGEKAIVTVLRGKDVKQIEVTF